MNFFRKLGLLNSVLLIIVVLLVGERIFAWAQYYNSEKIQPALRENKAKQNTIKSEGLYNFKSQLATDSWSIFTGPEPELSLFSVKYPPGCFAVRTYQVTYCSFNQNQRMASHTTVEDEVFYIENFSNWESAEQVNGSWDGKDFKDAAQSVIDQNTSSNNSWRLDDFQVLQEGKAIVDGADAYLLKLRGKPLAGSARGPGQPIQNFSTGIGKDGYVYQNYLIFALDYVYVDYLGKTKNEKRPYALYNESKETSQYFDTVASTIHFLQK